MFLIPIVGGALAGLLIRDRKAALWATAALWIAASALLLVVTATDDADAEGITGGSWLAVAIGLLGFPLAYAAHRLRNRRE